MVPEDLAGEYRFVESLDDANVVRLVESVATGEPGGLGDDGAVKPPIVEVGSI